MTTIAYKDGVLAADTLMTSGGARCGYQAKIERRGRLVLGHAGVRSNYEAFRDWIAAGAPGRFTCKDGNVFVIAPGELPLVWGDGDTPWRETEPFWALGAGERYAVGAMAQGASARKAVKVAMQFDTATGGEVTVLRVSGGE